ncbi:MAG: hypothetical protein CEE40_06540 [Chloroflexi bacterium B3_Chlor]|nr:MAG: hypothetical protein CEE40_06540 [Chloroflexi bacterium B3_Chlor]
MNFRVSRRWWVSIGTTVVLLTLAWVVGTALAQEPGPEGAAELQEDVSLAAMVADKINYQGRLTDSVGAPLNGTFPMQFQIYDDATLGTMLWDSGTISVDVDQGLFNVQLAVDPADFDGQALWLRINVNGEWLLPRQELVPVPYALSLRPGAQIVGAPSASDGWVLKVDVNGFYPLAKAVSASAATGSAIRGESTGGWGVRGFTQDGYGVYGTDGGTTEGEGYGGYFTSSNGVPLGGYSTAQRSFNNNHAAGIYGSSENGVGVVGWGENSDWSGIGVFGYGYGGAGGRFMTYSGNIIEGWQDVNGDGFNLQRRFRVANNGDVYADRAYHCGPNYTGTGADGTIKETDLEAAPCLVDNSPADFAEALPAAEGLAPGAVLVVGPDGRLQQSHVPYAANVAGVYSTRPSYVGNGQFLGQDGYVPVTLMGLVPVKASAENGPIRPGDLLVASSTPAHAMRAGDNPQVGTVIGKALEPLEVGTGEIQMLVTLQ